MTTAIYDENCVLCRQSKRIVTALDWFKRVEWLDANDWERVHERYSQLDFDTAMGQMHVDEGDGKLLGGYFAVRRLLRDLPLGFPLWLILHIPGMSFVGQVLYRFIARNRYKINRMVGAPVCDATSCKVHFE